MNMVTLGRRIKEQRMELGFTQKELAEKVGLSLQSIVKYERGEREPTFANLNKLSKVLGVKSYELLSKDNTSSFPTNSHRRKLSAVNNSQEFFKLVLSWCPLEDFKNLTKRDIENMTETFALIYDAIIQRNKKSN